MSQFQYQVRRNFSSSGCPATLAIIAVNVLTFLLFNIFHGGIWNKLIFSTTTFHSAPWTIFTYTLMGVSHPITILFAGLWAYWSCSSLERSWGTNTFLLFYFITNAIMALAVWLGVVVFLHSTVNLELFGLAYGIAPPTIAWCTVNKRETISLYGIIPITAWALAVFTLVLLWYDVGAPVYGLFPFAGCAAAWWFADRGRMQFALRSSSRKHTHLRMMDREQEVNFQKVPLSKRYKAWQDRRKLDALWKRSSDTDPEEKKHK